MSNNKKYNFAILLSIFSLIILIIQNYRVEKIIAEKQDKVQKIEKKVEAKHLVVKKFGYNDIVNAVGNQDGIKITKFIQQKESDIALVEVEILGELTFVEKTLENIENKENFQNVQNIKMEKCEDDKIITKVNVNFIRNK